MEKQKTRSEIEEKYKWDLTRIYKSDDEWYSDYKNLCSEIEKINGYKDDLFSSSDRLHDYLLLKENIEKLRNKLFTYSNLRQSEDSTNVEYQKMYSLISDLSIKENEYESFYDELFFNTDFSIILEYAKNDELINSYLKVFERSLRYKDHYLSKDKEEIISKLLKPMYTASDVYSMLIDTEIKYGVIKDENGNDVELTESNFSRYITSKNRNVRRDAFNKLYETLSNYKNTITLTYTGDIDATIALNKVYNYNSSIEASLFGDNIDISVYDNLINCIHNNLDKLYNYFDIKKKIMNLDEIHLYDMYVKVVDANDKNYSYEEARDLILEALKPLGDDYLTQAKSIFDNRLIDVYNNVGKNSGAFSSGTYDTDPFILTNFEGKYKDVSTIAHELGHSMHTMYSNKNNLRQYSDYKIFVAEVASTVNELLLSFYMLKTSNNKNEKLMILNDLLDNYKATIYRQTMFAEFEKEMYRRREAGEALTNDIICDYYYDLNKKYFGDNVFVDENIKYEWERIPHFYNAFYVYKYATSMSASVYIAQKIFDGDVEFRDKYIEFLKMGDREFPIDELKTLGIDMSKSDIINDAVSKFDELTKEFYKLYVE